MKRKRFTAEQITGVFKESERTPKRKAFVGVGRDLCVA